MENQSSVDTGDGIMVGKIVTVFLVILLPLNTKPGTFDVVLSSSAKVTVLDVTSETDELNFSIDEDSDSFCCRTSTPCDLLGRVAISFCVAVET